MQDLTMSSEEEEYDGTDNEEELESDESESHVSQMRILLGKKQKIIYKELNVSTEPHLPLPQNYEQRDFRRFTQSDGKCHLSTSVATTSAREGFKCRSVLVKLYEVYLILIEVPHLKQRLKAANLMSLFDCKVGNEDNQVIVLMVEHWWATTHTFYLPCGELGITPRDFLVHIGIGIGTGEPMIEISQPVEILMIEMIEIVKDWRMEKDVGIERDWRIEKRDLGLDNGGAREAYSASASASTSASGGESDYLRETSPMGSVLK
ncbi:hypothetical protein GIB67_025120 [Kingdonia uniflora]|uniref:Aminotransferase-like plant mobile domain-containing protein n=1 Tax=Kingdonia uniflora TaxID=39325 RepID=A0A7J7N7Z3_9MAGN|nr:hypothetical protein GIB67_025120 [Kingdonia uniflora]